MQQIYDSFLEIALKDVNERFNSFKNEAGNIFFVSRKICFNHKNLRWCGQIDVVDYFKTNIDIPCLFDFKTYREIPETHFYCIKDILNSLISIEECERSKISIFIYKKTLNVKLIGQYVIVCIKFYNDEPLFDEKRYSISDIKRIIC